MNATTTKYLRDGPNVIAEYEDTNTPVAIYLEGLGIDEQISKTIGANAYRYLTDHLGLVRQIVDSSQVVQSSYDYSSFGAVVGTPTENASNDCRFTTRAYDSELGWQYHRHRCYKMNLGRWNTKDPSGSLAAYKLHIYYVFTHLG